MSTRFIVAGMVRREGKFLLLKRRDDEVFYPGVYEPVCGHIREFELAENCILRELKEETGLDGKIFMQGRVFEAHDGHGRWIVVPFLVDVESDTVNLSEEHTTFKWVSPDELDNDEFIRGIKKDFASVGLV